MILSVLLIATPVLFTAAYAGLGIRFGYPAILREPTTEILRRFRAGGAGLILLWWVFAMSALLFVPVAVLAGDLVVDPGVRTLSIALGVLAAAVQTLGLIRWVYLVPYLAREADAGADPTAVDLVFQAFHRYLGVAVGEHLGYLLTGAWTLAFSLGAASALPVWLVVAGVVIATMLLLGSVEFLGPFERSGWAIAGHLVSIGYTIWAVWLVAIGIVLLVA